MPMRTARVRGRALSGGYLAVLPAVLRQSVRLAALAGVLAALPAVSAQEDLDPRVSGDTIVIFDASGSMRQPVLGDPGLPVKFDLARRAASRLVAKFADRVRGASLGFVAFGLTPAPGLQAPDPAVKDKAQAQSCRDVTVVQPLKPLSSALAGDLRERIRGFEMHGETPLGLAVSSAVEQLRGGGSIVVITDMDNTCEDVESRANDYVCRVLERANRTRLRADRVYLDSIILLPPNVDRDTGKPSVPGAVTALRKCEDSATLPIAPITEDAEAEAETDAIVNRLARLADRRGRDAPTVTSAPGARTFSVIDDKGRLLLDQPFEVRFSDGRSPLGGYGSVRLPSGIYDLTVFLEGRDRIRISVDDSLADVVVTIDP